jgi:hypothetical protein
MQRRTLLILKRCALVAFVLAASQAIVVLYFNSAAYNRIGDIGLAQWIALLGDAFIALATMFFAVFIAAAAIVMLILGIARYVHDRIYRTPTL